MGFFTKTKTAEENIKKSLDLPKQTLLFSSILSGRITHTIESLTLNISQLGKISDESSNSQISKNSNDLKLIVETWRKINNLAKIMANNPEYNDNPENFDPNLHILSEMNQVKILPHISLPSKISPHYSKQNLELALGNLKQMSTQLKKIINYLKKHT